jgi:RNA polymerase sigma factor (sigma-70 family)
MSGSLDDRIVAMEPELRGFIARRAGRLLAFDELEDLVQTALLRALERAPGTHFDTDAELRAWLFKVAASALQDRREHWRTLKRGAARIVRLTWSERPTEGAASPPAPGAGPLTWAAGRELVALAARAVAALPERDRDLVRWRSEGVPLEEQAARLGLDYATVQRAGLRAMERFEKLFELALRAARR